MAEKLLVKPGASVWVSDPDRRELLDPLPPDVRIVDGPADAGVAVLFADDAASARTVLERHRDDVTAPPVVWVAYPKGGCSDINRDTLWPIVAEFGLRPNGQVAVDDVWSALRCPPPSRARPRSPAAPSRQVRLRRRSRSRPAPWHGC